MEIHGLVLPPVCRLPVRIQGRPHLESGLPWWLSGKDSVYNPEAIGDANSTPGSEMATTPIFLPEKSHGQRSLARYHPSACRRVGHYLATKQQKITFRVSILSEGHPYPSLTLLITVGLGDSLKKKFFFFFYVDRIF